MRARTVGKRDRQHGVTQPLPAASIEGRSRGLPIRPVSPSEPRPMPSGRTGRAGSGCRASISCRGWCGPRSISAWEQPSESAKSGPFEKPSPVPITATMARAVATRAMRRARYRPICASMAGDCPSTARPLQRPPPPGARWRRPSAGRRSAIRSAVRPREPAGTVAAGRPVMSTDRRR